MFPEAFYYYLVGIISVLKFNFKYSILLIDEYEREETRQVYVDLNNNIEVSGSEHLIF